MTTDTITLQPSLAITSKASSIVVSEMDPITTTDLVKKVGLVVQACWSVGASLFEVQRERNEIDEPLEQLSEEVKGLRSVLDGFHGCLRKVLAKRPYDEDEYQMIWDATFGTVEDCGNYLNHFVDLLSNLRGEYGHESGVQPHLQPFRSSVHRADLDKSRLQLQGHKYNLNICLTMLVTHICSDLASQEGSPLDSRLNQLPLASRQLEKALTKQAMPPTYDTVDPSHVFRLKETAENVLHIATSVSSKVGSPAPRETLSDRQSMRSNDMGTSDRQTIEMWIKQLRIVQEEPEVTQVLAYSDLPEVSLASPTPQPSTFDEIKSDSTQSTMEQASDSEDEFELQLIRELTIQGKEHFGSGNRVQAIDCLQRALQYASDLDTESSNKVDLTEIRSVLATIYLQRKDYQTAEQYLLAVVNNRTATSLNSPFVGTAHLQLAKLYLTSRNFSDARKHCRLAIKGRMKAFGRASAQYHEALQVQAIIFHAEGSHPEAEAILKMLPEHLAEETRDDLQSQSQIPPTFTLFPSPKSPSSRPSIANDQVSPRRPTTHTVSSTTSTHQQQENQNNSQSFHKLSNQDEQKYRGERSFSQPRVSPTTYARAPIPIAASPQLSDTVSPLRQTFDVHSRSTSMPSPSISNSSVSQSNMECLTVLAHGGFSGDFEANKAMEWAIMYGHERVVSFLIEGYPVTRPRRRFSIGNEPGYILKKVSPDGHSKDKVPPLIMAITCNQVLIVRLLLERGAKLTCTNDRDQGPLLVAAEHGSAEIIRILLDKGVNVDLSGQIRSWTPWHAAAQNGHEEVLHLFLEKGAAIDAADVAGQTALKLAAARGHLPACELLIDQGARLDAEDDTGWTPLHSAVKHGHTDVTKLMLRSGATVNVKNRKQQTPLMLAAREGREQETKMLLGKGAQLEVADDRSYTPLLAACSRGHVEITQLLIAHGANVNAHCARGSTPLDHAVKGRYRAIQQFLRGSGASKGTGLTEAHMQTHDAFMGYTM